MSIGQRIGNIRTTFNNINIVRGGACAGAFIEFERGVDDRILFTVYREDATRPESGSLGIPWR